MTTLRAVAILSIVSVLATTAPASESASPNRTQTTPRPTLKPVSDRFAPDAASEVPSFRRHVVPLLGKLGCNGRACHGSFQGRGGFRLSLFGYDFKLDHEALLAKSSAEDARASIPAVRSRA